MNKRYIIYIVIAIICVIAIISGVYYQVFENKPKQKQNTVTNEIVDNQDPDEVIDPEILKEEFNSLFNNSFDDQGYDTSTIQKIQGLEEQNIIYAAYNIKEEKDERYSVDINLPVFNVQGDTVAEFNRTTQAIFADKANDVLSKSDPFGPPVPALPAQP